MLFVNKSKCNLTYFPNYRIVHSQIRHFFSASTFNSSVVLMLQMYMCERESLGLLVCEFQRIAWIRKHFPSTWLVHYFHQQTITMSDSSAIPHTLLINVLHMMHSHWNIYIYYLCRKLRVLFLYRYMYVPCRYLLSLTIPFKRFSYVCVLFGVQ